MSEIIQVDRQAMTDLANGFTKFSKLCAEAINVQNKVNQSVVDGALHGQTGSGYQETIKQTITPVLQRLSEKCDEVAKDILFELESVTGADKKSAQSF